MFRLGKQINLKYKEKREAVNDKRKKNYYLNKYS